MYKGLVTSGCSFSLYDPSDEGHPHGWPYYLQKQLLSDGILSEDFSSFHRGLGGNGNMLIARNTMEALNRLLKKDLKGEEILCIVEWSGTSRNQFYIDRASFYLSTKSKEVPGDLYQYDVGIRFEDGEYKDLSESKRNGYYLVNQPSDLNLKFQSHINDVIESLWNWTTLQNYCEVNNIKPYYTFMYEHDKEMLLDDDVGDPWAWKYLRDNIIIDNVLTSINKHLEEHLHKNLFLPDGHPNKRGHKVFSDYLKKSLTNI